MYSFPIQTPLLRTLFFQVINLLESKQWDSTSFSGSKFPGSNFTDNFYWSLEPNLVTRLLVAVRSNYIIGSDKNWNSDFVSLSAAQGWPWGSCRTNYIYICKAWMCLIGFWLIGEQPRKDWMCLCLRKFALTRIYLTKRFYQLNHDVF